MTPSPEKFNSGSSHSFLRDFLQLPSLRTTPSRGSVPTIPLATPLLALELVLLDGKGLLEQLLLFLAVDVFQTSSNRRARATASVHDVFAVVVLGLVEQSLDAGLHKAPGTGVERLLLGPDDGLRVWVHVEVLLQLLPREGVHLLDAGKGNVVDLVVGTVLVQSTPDLTSAENDAIHLFRGLDSASLVLRVGDDPLETSILSSEFLEA